MQNNQSNIFTELETKLPLIDKHNPFLNLNTDKSLKRLSKMINQEIYYELKIHGGVNLYYGVLLETRPSELLIKDLLYSNKIITVKLDDIRGIEEHNSWNQESLPIDLYINKIVKLTNKNNDIIYAILRYIEDYNIYFDVKYMDNDTIVLSNDISYPIKFLKKIELVDENVYNPL